MDLSAKELPRTVGRIARIGQRFACVGDAVPNCGAKAQLATFAGRRRKPKDPGRAIRMDAQHQACAIVQITGAGRLNLARAEQIPGHFDLPLPPGYSPKNSCVGVHRWAFSRIGPSVERSGFPCNFKHIAHLLARMCNHGGMVSGGGGGNRTRVRKRSAGGSTCVAGLFESRRALGQPAGRRTASHSISSREP